jgi:hypothetical protein
MNDVIKDAGIFQVGALDGFLGTYTLNSDFRDPNPSRLEGLTHEYGLAA